MGPQEDYIETVFTCEGDYHDPHLKDRLEDFKRSLRDLLLTDKSKLILKKVEPWNSVRVTFKIPREAAVRLKQLAQQGNTTLKDLGVLAVQIQDQNISLTIAGKNNEPTQLVFRTADTAQTAAPSVSVVRTSTTGFEGLMPHGPGPGPSLTAAVSGKDIAEYIRQLSGHLSEGQKAKKNNIVSPHGIDVHKSPLSHLPAHTSHHGIPSSLSPPSNSLSPSQSPGAQMGPKFPQQVQGFPGDLSADMLRPPPPYPGEASGHLNNVQKAQWNAQGQFLVNLLKNVANSAELEAQEKAVKKKRKPRKPREKKKKEVDATATCPANVVPPTTSTDMFTGVPSATVTSLPTPVPNVNHNFNPAVMKEQGFQNISQASLHNTSVQSVSEQIVPLTSNPITTPIKKSDDGENTAGKIINPVTGVLEPMELSDTSPVKSDNDKSSPRSLAAQHNALLGERKLDVRKSSLTSGIQGKNFNPHQLNRQLSEHVQHQSALSSGSIHKALGSSHLSNFDAGRIPQQVQIQESLKNNFLSHGKNDVISSLDKLEHMLPRNSRSEAELEAKCDKLGTVGMQTQNVETHTKVQKAQEVDSNTIPPQLLNKPLLQVKHNSVSGKPSGSPDSNGDSECSSQGISLDTHSCPEPSAQSGSHADQRSYNTDSGVGSCSERSDDTPSEPGDNDFKQGNTNSFECAKTVGLDTPLKQPPPPNAKVMTVGYALDETSLQKDLKNHKIVSTSHSNDKLVNSALSLTKTKMDVKTDMCSTSQSSLLNWATEDKRMFANNIEAYMKRAAQEAANRKSPKLASSVHNSIPNNMDSMQGSLELSMQPKKKTSPRNSPRQPSSPRTPGSPRGSSPRTVDMVAAPPGLQAFMMNQEMLSAHMASRESHIKTMVFREGGRSPLLEQRKSPFNMQPQQTSQPAAVSTIPSMMVPHQNSGEHLQHASVGIESAMRRPAPCNLDNITMLKSIETFAGPHVMTMNKDAAILQKIRELEPFFQKIPNPAQLASTAGPAVANGLENINCSARSPGPSIGPVPPKTSNHGVQHSVNNNSSSMSVSLSNYIANAYTSSANISSSVQNSVQKNAKGNTDDQKSSVVSSAASRKLSPSSAKKTSSQQFDTLLMQPNALTESIQKLLNFPLDPSTSLPHSRRSPSSCASTTRSTTSNAPPHSTVGSGARTSTPVSLSSQAPAAGISIVGSAGLSSAHNLVTDTSQIDIDSITPTVGIGPIELDTSNSALRITGSSHTSSSAPTVTSIIETSKVTSLYPAVVSSTSTKLVPAVKGSIPSYKSGGTSVSSKPASVSSSHSNHEGTSSNAGVSSVSSSVTVTEVKCLPCNSDSKMASSSANSVSSVSVSNSTVEAPGPPVLQPQVSNSIRYPVQSVTENAKTPYPQMGLSEMLQETARKPSVVSKPTDLPKQTTTSASSVTVSSSKAAEFVEQLKSSIEKQIKAETAKSALLHGNHANSNKPSDVSTPSTPSEYVNNSTSDNSDIPKLKRQTNLNLRVNRTNSTPSPLHTPQVGSDSCDSDMGKSQDSCSSSSSTPPILTAMGDIQEGKRSMSEETDLSSLESDHISANEELAVPQPEQLPVLDKPRGANVKPQSLVEPVCLVNDNPPVLLANKSTVELSEKKINSLEDVELSHVVSNIKKSTRKRRASSESVEERSSTHEDSDMAPRQLRSRKRTNLSENDTEDPKKIKLESNTETTPVKVENKELRSLTPAPEIISVDETTDSIKAGLRTRTSSKAAQSDTVEKPKVAVARESRKDSKVATGKTLPEKKAEPVKPEDGKRAPQARRNRQSPSTQPPDKPPPPPATTIGLREKSPMRGSRTRGRASPVTVDNSEESQENKRTTRSHKTKDNKEAATPTSGKAPSTAAAKRRRTSSQDHR